MVAFFLDFLRIAAFKCPFYRDMCVTCVAEQNLRIMILFSVSKVPGSGAIPLARLADRLRIFSMSTRLSNIVTSIRHVY